MRFLSSDRCANSRRQRETRLLFCRRRGFSRVFDASGESWSRTYDLDLSAWAGSAVNGIYDRHNSSSASCSASRPNRVYPLLDCTAAVLPDSNFAMEPDFVIRHQQDKVWSEVHYVGRSSLDASLTPL